MYKHRAKVVCFQYVYRFFHVYSMYKHRAKVSFVMLSCCRAVMFKVVLLLCYGMRALLLGAVCSGLL